MSRVLVMAGMARAFFVWLHEAAEHNGVKAAPGDNGASSKVDDARRRQPSDQFIGTGM